MGINYTTYDVHRRTDTINPRTPHRDIMVLANVESDSDHPYMYARVIGIFHVNVVYMATDVVDCRPRRIDFLWVRWYELVPKSVVGGWKTSALDQLRFPPIDHEGSFGFLDPADVLRAAHVIPAFATGRRHPDGNQLSASAQNGDDWKRYYLMR